MAICGGLVHKETGLLLGVGSGESSPEWFLVTLGLSVWLVVQQVRVNRRRIQPHWPLWKTDSRLAQMAAVAEFAVAAVISLGFFLWAL